MSTSGRRALQGFTYQAYVALDWLVEMIHQDRDDPIEAISVDSVGLLDADRMPKVDDIVVRFESGETLYVQAKKNQTDRKAWSLADSPLQKELRSARDQLEEDEEGRIRFYSRDPFGEVCRLAEAPLSLCQADEHRTNPPHIFPSDPPAQAGYASRQSNAGRDKTTMIA